MIDMIEMNLYPPIKGDDGRDDYEERDKAKRWFRDMFDRVFKDPRVLRNPEDVDDLQAFYMVDHENGELRPLFETRKVTKKVKVEENVFEDVEVTELLFNKKKVNFDKGDLWWEMYRKARDGELLIRGLGEDHLRVMIATESDTCGFSNPIGSFKVVSEPKEPPAWKQVLYKISLGLLFSGTMEKYEEEKHLAKMSLRVNEQVSEICEKAQQKLEEEKNVRKEILDEQAAELMKENETSQNKRRKELTISRDREIRQIAKNPKAQEKLDKITDNRDAYLDISAELRSYNDFFNRIGNLLGPNRKDPEDMTEGPNRVYDPESDLKLPEFSSAAVEHFKRYKYSDLHIGVLCLAASGTPMASSAYRAEDAERTNDLEGKAVLVNNQNRFDFRNMVKDMFVGNVPNAGRKYEALLQEGRDIVNKNIGFYEGMDETPLHLGRLFVDAIRDCNIIFNSAPTLDKEAVAFGLLAGQLVELVTSRFDLEKTAKNQGLTEKDMQMARGAADMAKIRIQGLKAQKTLIEAGAGNKKLSPEKTKELLTCVHAMRMATMEHEAAYMKTVRSDAYIARQSDLNALADEWTGSVFQGQSFGFKQRKQDAQDIKKYGQDEAFKPSKLAFDMGAYNDRYKEMYGRIYKTRQIDELAKLSPADLAKHVMDAAKPGSAVDRFNDKIFQEWKGRENAPQQPEQIRESAPTVQEQKSMEK